MTQLGKVGEKLGLAATPRKESQYLPHSDSSATDARLAEANFGIDADAVQMLHWRTLSPERGRRQ